LDGPVSESSLQLLLIFSVVSTLLSLIVLIIVVMLVLRRPEALAPIISTVMGDVDKNLRNELSVQARTNRTEVTEGISRSFSRSN
jgi:hypothetical protein